MEEIIISERKTREDIVNIINNSGLPACMLKPILKDLYDQINILTEEQYNQAVQNKEKEKEKEGEEHE